MPIFDPHVFDPTAFMSGQMLSKTWLCRNLEEAWWDGPKTNGDPTIWLLGGWYGVTSLLLCTRERMPIRKIVNFDIDPEAVKGSRILNEAYVNRGVFSAVQADATALDYTDRPDIVVNTSVEHMPDRSWFPRIPDGTMVVLQSNDMQHDDHVFNHKSADELAKDFPLSEIIMTGELPFEYSDWAFKRFMVIGVK